MMNLGRSFILNTFKQCRLMSNYIPAQISSYLTLKQTPSIIQSMKFLPAASFQAKNYSISKNIDYTSSLHSLSPFSNLRNSDAGILSKVKSSLIVQTCSVIKFSKVKGKKKTEIDIIKRFKRLDWGIWIRPKAGAERKVWKKSNKRMNRLRQNVFCNATQSRRLDKMVTSYWRRERVFADDPYAPYLKREDFGPTRQAPTQY